MTRNARDTGARSKGTGTYVLVTSKNMVRLPGCYDVHWPDYMDWLWAHWG